MSSRSKSKFRRLRIQMPRTHLDDVSAEKAFLGRSRWLVTLPAALVSPTLALTSVGEFYRGLTHPSVLIRQEQIALATDCLSLITVLYQWFVLRRRERAKVILAKSNCPKGKVTTRKKSDSQGGLS
ncbi:MAG: hypothetical protein JWR07_5093 [Nevskia sp.]|nr:hypothetical protein [Nevskia sp.]